MATSGKASASRPCPRGRCTEDRIAINAPVETVWSILADLPRWDAWNPLYAETSGRFAEGEEVALTVTLAGGRPHRARATVTLAEEPRCIEYGMSQLGGLLRVHRYIELTRTGSASCRVANGEIMTGLLAGIVARFVTQRLRDGLKGMNEALKAQAEQRAGISAAQE